jgi:hypothetical protein
MRKDVLKRKKAQQAVISSYKVLADDTNIIDLNAFISLDSVVCRTFDVITGKTISFPVQDWFKEKHYRQYALVLHDDSNSGKTQLALSLAAEISLELQRKANLPPYFIKVGTVDALREAIDRNLMAPNIPILFDECTAGRMSTSPCMSLEDVKHLCEILETTTVDGRNNDISFHRNQRRIFTSNAWAPHGWHRELPSRVFRDNTAIRKNYEPDVTAVFKRVVFAEVPTCLIGQAMRDEHQRSLTGAAAFGVRLIIHFLLHVACRLVLGGSGRGDPGSSCASLKLKPGLRAWKG